MAFRFASAHSSSDIRETSRKDAFRVPPRL